MRAQQEPNEKPQPCQCVAALAVILITSLVTRADEPVDFQRQISPLFAEHCLECHGPDERVRQAGLRLDVRDVAFSARDSGRTAIVPGEPTESELLSRVTSEDPNVVMPPPEHENPLKPEQISLLRRWIAEGAPYSGHWAFAAPRRPTVPVVDTLVRNPIDAFVAEGLLRDGLKPSPPASHETLCRRIYLDVLGLPPTPDEVHEFVKSAQEAWSGAVGGLVDRLLSSERFGEKWARHWLDVARYADTHGYEKDNPRQQWAWREWVICAINDDMPYDQFIIEQIAGDLLPDGTQEQLVATGFLRNSMINEEGAIDHEEFRMAALFDRMDCVGKAVLGLSIQCAQCHSHKFDPISQHEYYGMFAFLNNTSEAQSWVYSPKQREKITTIQQSIHGIEDRLKADRSDWQRQLASWEKEQRATMPKWDVLDTVDEVWVGGLHHPEELADHSIVLLGNLTGSGVFYVEAQPPLDGVTGLRLEALTHGDSPFGGPGRSDRGAFAIAELRVASQLPGSVEWVDLPLKNATADFSEEDQPFGDDQKKRVGPVTYLIDGKEETAWRADRGPGRRNTESVAVVQFAGPLDLAPGTRLRVTLVFRHGTAPSTQVGRARFALTRSPDPSAPPHDYAATLAMRKPRADRTSREQAAVFAAWRRSVSELKDFNDQILAMENQYPDAHTSVLSVIAREPEIPRHTFLLDRGVWNKPLERVTPRTPAVLHSTLAKNSSRLDYARWLVDRRSPLAARVQVNRAWQAIFGVGLVDTPEDFGTRTVQPEHLDLLDWLAVEFMDQGWSTKQLIRKIVTSATYQQTSRVTAAMLERDPGNRLLGRGPRFRAEAEVVRDIVLSVSGLLHHKLGGPSIFPPVPKSVRDYNYGQMGYWVPATGPERYRRAIYVFRKRAMPDAALTSLDAPNGDFSCARRVRSNTPMAALATLNEPIFVEAARALALRILREGGKTEEERTVYAFRLCTGRSARPAEVSEVLTLLNNRRERLAEGWLSINEVATGDPAQGPKIPPHSTPLDAAAWTIAARVILNLDATISKD
jgi:mono/diheme cytochrome c family protein